MLFHNFTVAKRFVLHQAHLRPGPRSTVLLGPYAIVLDKSVCCFEASPRLTHRPPRHGCARETRKEKQSKAKQSKAKQNNTMKCQTDRQTQTDKEIRSHLGSMMLRGHGITGAAAAAKWEDGPADEADPCRVPSVDVRFSALRRRAHFLVVLRLA